MQKVQVSQIMRNVSYGPGLKQLLKREHEKYPKTLIIDSPLEL